MKYPFFASFLVLCAVFYHNRKKSDKNYAKIMQDYFNRENEANNTRKQPLDDLEYIDIPLELINSIQSDDAVIQECISDLRKLYEEKIVNFTGISNTDLKLKYGPANLPYLQRCDFNYTQLVTLLYNLANRLYELDRKDSALSILEYAVDIKADVSKIYYLAATIYIENGTAEKIDELIATAESLNSAMKNSIVKSLKEYR